MRVEGALAGLWKRVITSRVLCYLQLASQVDYAGPTTDQAKHVGNEWFHRFDVHCLEVEVWELFEASSFDKRSTSFSGPEVGSPRRHGCHLTTRGLVGVAVCGEIEMN